MEAFGIIADDIDGDGKPDLTVTNSIANTFSVLRNQVDVVLPLRLLDFTGTQIETNIELKWQTANELNTAYFDIERSANGIRFSPIRRVPSLKNSSGYNSYNYTDSHPMNGANYYRLNMVDADGKSSYSHVVVVNFANAYSLLCYPNPAKDILTVVYKNLLGGTIQFSIFDVIGKKVFTRTQVSIEGNNVVDINISSLSKGVYTFQLINGAEKKTVKFTIKIKRSLCVKVQPLAIHTHPAYLCNRLMRLRIAYRAGIFKAV